MIFGGVKITYPKLGLILCIIGLGGNQAGRDFDLVVRSVPPLSRLTVIVLTFRVVPLIHRGEWDRPHSGSVRRLGKKLNKPYTPEQ